MVRELPRSQITLGLRASGLQRRPVLPRKPRGEVLGVKELLLQGEGVRQGLRPVEWPDGAPGVYMNLDFAYSP